MRGEKLGLFERIFKYRNDLAAAGEVFKMLNGYTPAFTSWNGKIYESLLVRSAIHARATHISKLQVSFQGTAKLKMQNAMRYAPNPWQTWGQFLYRTSTILDIHNTAFLVPVLDEYGQNEGVFTVLPNRCELREYGGIVYLRYEFANGQHAAIELDRCGVLSKFLYQNDIFGETNDALNPTMELVNIQTQGITEAVKSSATYRFMARLTNFSDPKDLAKEQKRFTRNNLQSGSGVLLWPNTYDSIQQIKSSPYVVDADQMKAIESNVFNYFGVNEDVLQNKAVGDVLNAFYDGGIEPFVVQAGDVLTAMHFTPRERALGSALSLQSNRFQFLTTKEKLLVTQTLADRGLATKNTILAIWGLPPLPGKLGEAIPERGEYKNLMEGKGDKNAAE